MHQTRQEVITKIPIARKGDKYVARAKSHLGNSVPVVVAVRDLLNLARNSKEVKAMIHNKQLKLNGRLVRDNNESIKPFNVFEADKKYILSYLDTGRFVFEETKANERICKVISRNLLPGGKMQIIMHDGTCIIGSKDIKVGDTIILSFDGKIKSHISFDKGKSGIVIAGKYLGEKVKVVSFDAKNKSCTVKLKEKETELPSSAIIIQ